MTGGGNEALWGVEWLWFRSEDRWAEKEVCLVNVLCWGGDWTCFKRVLNINNWSVTYFVCLTGTVPSEESSPYIYPET